MNIVGIDPGKTGALALFTLYQRAAERLFPVLEFTPHMAVGKAECARGGRDGAVLAHRLQHLHQRIADLPRTAAAGTDRVGKVDLLHGAGETEMEAGSLCRAAISHRPPPCVRPSLRARRPVR